LIIIAETNALPKENKAETPNISKQITPRQSLAGVTNPLDKNEEKKGEFDAE
jgi:hypothetical protein